MARWYFSIINEDEETRKVSMKTFKSMLTADREQHEITSEKAKTIHFGEGMDKDLPMTF